MELVLFFKHCFICFVCLLEVLLCSKDFGPFEVQILNFQSIIYEKFKKDIDLKINVNCIDKSTCSLNIYGNVKKNMGVLGMRLRNFRWEENLQKNVLAFTVESKSLCEHVIFRMIKGLIPGISPDCKLKPNVYNVSIPDLQNLGRLLFNNMFYYGKYTSITELRGSRGRFLQMNCTSLIFQKSVAVGKE